MKTWQKVALGLVLVGALWWAYSNGYFSSAPPVNPNALDGGGTGWTGSAGGPSGGGTTATGVNVPAGVSIGSTIVPGGGTPVPVIDPNTGQPYVDAGGSTIFSNLGQTVGTFGPIGISKGVLTNAIRAGVIATKGTGVTAVSTPAVSPTPTPSTVTTNAPIHLGGASAFPYHPAVTGGLQH